MLKRLLILTALLVAVLMYRSERGPLEEGNGTSPATGAGLKESGSGEGPGRLPTKSKARHEPGAGATHRPERLREFYLPEVDLHGLPLEAALLKLRAAYEDACRESGESPLRLSFTVPSGMDRPLRMKLGGQTLDTSVRHLAALSGLKVTRVGAEYRFEAPVETGEAVKRVVEVPPDFESWWASEGVELDPSTRLDLKGGKLTIETSSKADEVALTSLIHLRSKEAPIQQKLQIKILGLKSDADWTPPDLSQLDPSEVQLFMRSMAQMEGTQLRTMPSAVTRPGQPVKIETTGDLITPVIGSDDAFETHRVGQVFNLTPLPLGFGHRVAMHFSDTKGDIEPESGAARITRNLLEAKSFAADGNATLHVQTHPDGTRMLVLVTPTLIDATGTPLRSAE